MARRSSHGRLKAEINIVPYIDVMLVLLVIFMVTAPLLNQGVEVDLPKAPAEPIDTHNQDSEVVVLSIRKDGRCFLNVGAEQAQAVDCDTPVSYTHLDVYKRQTTGGATGAGGL